MKILRRGFLHIQRVYQYFILSRLHICSSRETSWSKGSPSLLPLLCSPRVAAPSIGYDYATHCLRAAFQYNRVRTPHESLGRKCLGVSLAHPDASTIYQKLNLAAFDSDSNQIDRCKLSQFLTNETFDLCRAIFRRFRNSIFENSKNCAILQKRDLFLKFIIPW